MGFLDDALDEISDVVDSGTKLGGKILQKGSHLAGDVLDDVGLHGAAQTVSGWGDDVADEAGVKVGERSLEESDDPTQLVHGDAKRINEVAGHLKKFHDAFDKTATALARMDHDHWTGQAAENFRKQFDPQPKQWAAAADACGKAGEALGNYAHTVTWAQGQAKEAAEAWKAAQKKVDAALKTYQTDVMTYNLRVEAYNATPADQRPASPPADPGKFSLPQEAVSGFHQAEEKLNAARTQRDSAARTALAAINALVQSAPAKPSRMQILKADVRDQALSIPALALHTSGGLVGSVTDLVRLGRGLNFSDPYNLTHPAEYLQGVSTTIAGLVKTSQHPSDLVKGIVGSGWGSDPAEASGKLFGNVLIGAATGGGGTAASVAEREATAVAENAAKDAAQNAAKEAAEKAAQEAAEKAARDAHRVGAAATPVDIEKIEVGASGYKPVWRESTEPLWRYDDRHPDEIFGGESPGFKPQNNDNYNLWGYADANKESIFVGTTRDPAYTLPRSFKYEIDAPGGIDINKTLEDLGYNHTHESEIAFAGGIKTENIKGAWRLDDNRNPVEWIPNPRYRPTVGTNIAPP